MKQDYVPPEYNKTGFNCPHCGAFAHQRWRFRVDATKPPTGGSESSFLHSVSASICERCKEFSIWTDEKLVFPAMCVAPLPASDMPSEAKGDYEEARAIFGQSPRGAAALGSSLY